MSHGGSGNSNQGSCTSVSLGKYVRRALRAASGRPKKHKPRDHHSVDCGGVSLELISSSTSASASASARRDSVVRVVLSSGVVEVYTGVVLACTVIRKHPPGLCLAHPDVFRNPHGARVRPLEPLLPGQKFLLLPESTIEKLQRNIPEGSVGAFDEEEEEANHDEDDGDGSEAGTLSTETSSSEGQDHSGGSASSEEERQSEPAAAGDHDGAVLINACCAREYFVANERWAECQFKKMVSRRLAVEQSAEPAERREKGKRKKKKKEKKGKKRNDPAAAPSAGCRTFSRVATTPRRTWEPSLPSVEEGGDHGFSIGGQD